MENKKDSVKEKIKETYLGRFMGEYDDLEISILCCFLQKPKLIDEMILEDKHFIRYKRIWLFIKAAYKRFGTLDVNLLYSIAEDKYGIMLAIEWIIGYDGFPSLCLEYQKQLIALYEEKKKNKYIREKVFEVANDLYVQNISIEEFKEKLNKIDEIANIIYKNDK